MAGAQTKKKPTSQPMKFSGHREVQSGARTGQGRKQTETRFLPYGRQTVTSEDIAAVTRVLLSDWLTQGPTVSQFEVELARLTESKYAVTCSNGTAALHLAMMALGTGLGDKILTTPVTFMADANCARYVGADVLFADIDPSTACISPEAVRRAFENDPDHKIKAVIAVSFAGQAADLAAIHELASEHGATVVSDACHAIGGSYEHDDQKIVLGAGIHAELTVFSFHPVKHVAMGEGGAITCDSETLAQRLQLYRNHGIVRDGFANTDMAYTAAGEAKPWYHELQDLGYNYRLSEIHAALGLSQLCRLHESVERRNLLASRYRKLISETFEPGAVKPLRDRSGVVNAYHLFVVQIDFERFGISRTDVMNRLKEKGVGTQVHYIPIHLQPYYRKLYGHKWGDFPNAEAYYARALSLPMFPDLKDAEIDRVVAALKEVLVK